MFERISINNKKLYGDNTMESTIDDLMTRRSVREFSDKQISKEVLDKILTAGTYAPTGMDCQSPKIIVTQNKDTIKKFSDWNKSFFPPQIANMDNFEDMDPFYGAQTLVIVLADSSKPTYREDGNLVIGNILNAAHALGVGGCYIYRAKEEFDSPQAKELLKVWDLPESYVGIGHVILGYPADDFEPKDNPKKDDYILYIDEL